MDFGVFHVVSCVRSIASVLRDVARPARYMIFRPIRCVLFGRKCPRSPGICVSCGMVCLRTKSFFPADFGKEAIVPALVSSDHNREDILIDYGPRDVPTAFSERSPLGVFW